MEFSIGNQKDFLRGGGQNMKFHFSPSKLRKQPFLLSIFRKTLNFKIQGSRHFHSLLLTSLTESIENILSIGIQFNVSEDAASSVGVLTDSIRIRFQD